MPCHPQTQVCPCEQSQRHERESMRGRQAAADSCRKPNRDGWVLATDAQVPWQRDPLPSPYSNGTVPEAACPEIPEPARREERRLGGRHPEERGSKALEGGQGPEGGDAAPPALGPAPPGARGSISRLFLTFCCLQPRFGFLALGSRLLSHKLVSEHVLCICFLGCKWLGHVLTKTLYTKGI